MNFLALIRNHFDHEKLLLLEKRSVFFGSAAGLGRTLLTLVSLFPKMIEQGLYFAAGVKESAKDSNQNTEIQEESEGESRRSSRSGSGFVLKNLKKILFLQKYHRKISLLFWR